MSDPIKAKLQTILNESEVISERMDIEMTMQKMGVKILARMHKDDTLSNKVITSDDPDNPYQIDQNAPLLKGFLEKVASVDPTPTQKYYQWIIKMYVVGSIKRFEDMIRVKEPLMLFTKFKQKMPIKDINQIKSLEQLEEMTEPFIGELSGKEEKAELRKEMIEKGEAIIHLNTKEYSVMTPKTKEAAQEFGKETKWCTSALEDNMFNTYNQRGPLYILLHKPSNTRWQIQWESKQYMDAKDDPVNLYELFTEHPTFLKAKPISEHFGFTNEGGAAYWVKTPE